MQQAPRDEALENFSRVCFKRVEANHHHTALTFLAQFQSAAASLEPDERIKLVVYMHENSIELVKAVLSNEHANRVFSLILAYDGEEDANSIIPLLINNCPELASLWVTFKHHSVLDFSSSMLEHPSNKVKVLHMPQNTKGDLPRFFAALERSQVSAITIHSCDSLEFCQGLYEYLAKDLLARFDVWMGNKQLPFELIASLAGCTCLAEFDMFQCDLYQPTMRVSKSVTKLTLHTCTFVGGFDWSFLADSNVQDLDFLYVRGVDGRQLGGALAVHLRAQGLDTLRLWDCRFVNEILAAIGVELGRVKKLDIFDAYLNDASIKLIALALQSPNNEMKDLALLYNDDMASSIENHLVPALMHPNSVHLMFRTQHPRHEAATKTMQRQLRNRRALFALLQGQQVRRKYCPLRRLPVEMFRLVGMVLL